MTDHSPHLVAVYSSKGGSAKSTTTANVAAGLVARGYSVLVLDLDPQLSLVHLARKAKAKGNPLPFDVIEGYPEEEPSQDFVMMDHSPRVSANDRPPEEVEVMLIPFRPGEADQDSLVQAMEVLESYGAAPLFFWSQADLRTKIDRDFIQATEKESGEQWPLVPLFSGIRHAFNLAETVYAGQDYETRRRYKPARDAYDSLVDAVLARVSAPNNKEQPIAAQETL